MKTIVEYKGKKYTVRYEHTRNFTLTGHELYDRLCEHLDCCEEITKTDLSDIMALASQYNMSAFGGATTAYIELENGEEISATAECSEYDSYVKKTGRHISLGRLIKVLDS